MEEAQETWVWSLGQEDPLKEEMATHSSMLAGKIPWTEEPGSSWDWKNQIWLSMHTPYSFYKLNLEGFSFFFFTVLWSSLSYNSIILSVKSLVEFPWNFLVPVLILLGIYKTIFSLSSTVVVLFRFSVSAVINFAYTFFCKIIHFNLCPNYIESCAKFVVV